MNVWHRLRSWFHANFHRSHLERDMDAELRFHINAYTEDLVRSGVSREEALRRARIEFGGLELAKEQCREARGVTLLQSLAQDLHLAARVLRKNLSFTILAVLTLALGIGANSAIFAVVDAILLRPLPYHDPTNLVRLWETYPARGDFRNSVNPLNFLDWQDNSKAFQSMAAMVGWEYNLNAQGHPISVHGLQVSADFFSVLQVAPLHGRTFTSADAVPGSDHVVILGYDLWQSRFAGDTGVIGHDLQIDGDPYNVVGIMPLGFSFPKTKAEVWTPLSLVRSQESSSGGRYLTTVARLKPGITLEQARQDMLRVGHFTAEVRPDFDKGWSASVNSLLEDVTLDVRRPLWVLLASVGFLLLIACANVANLLLMRGAGRLRELAVRAALGASRWRLIRQLLVESLLLSLMGMAFGLLLATFGLHSLLALIPSDAPLPRSEPISIDAPVLLFTFLASLATAVVFGLVPALRLSRFDLQSALKQGALRSGVGGHLTLRRCFVIAEVALALLLSVGAGLLLHSFARLIAVNPGFQPERLLTMRISLPSSRYEDNSKRSAYFDNLLATIRSTPGVSSAGSTHLLPLTEMTSGSCFAPANGPKPTPAGSPPSQFLIVSPGYISAMGTPILQGRDFEARDNFTAAPVAVVNHAFADRFFSGKEVIGKQLWVCWDIDKPVEIVGIAADTRQADLQASPEPTIFLSNAQAPMYFATLVVRAEGDPRQIAASVQDAIHRVDPDQAISEVQTMESVLSDSLASPRFEAILLGVFATLAVALSVIGVYGIVSYSVTQRTGEIGIRVAMGALSSDIARMVLREALALTAISLLLGFAASFALSRLLESLLFEVKPTDPLTLISVGCAILIVSALAALFPARRAMRVDPMVALRYE